MRITAPSILSHTGSAPPCQVKETSQSCTEACVRLQSNNGPYFGGVVGRVANRIADARFTLDGTEHHLRANEGPNTLHSGPGPAWNNRVWTLANRNASSVTLELFSPDGDQACHTPCFSLYLSILFMCYLPTLAQHSPNSIKVRSMDLSSQENRSMHSRVTCLASPCCIKHGNEFLSEYGEQNSRG